MQRVYGGLLNTSNGLLSNNVNSGIVAFEMAYDLWVAEQQKKDNELKDMLQSHMLMPKLEPLTDEQLMSVSTLKHSCRQAEDALSTGMEKLQQTLAQGVTIDITGVGSYNSQMTLAMERLEGIENFLNQADHLRQQVLTQMYRILTPRQAAKGLIALGEYFQRLCALNSLCCLRRLIMAESTYNHTQ
nr:transcription factor TGA4-like [Tanacetum cinerariifolium]